MTVHGTKSRLHRRRQRAYGLLVVAVVAAICTGTGIGAATPPVPTDTLQSGATYVWSLLNHTGQPIYGNWNAEMASGDASYVEATAVHPWQPDDAAKAAQHNNWLRYTTWMGRICYRKRWWAYAFSDWGFGDTAFYGAPVFTLEADSTDALFVYFDTVRGPLTLQPLAC